MDPNSHLVNASRILLDVLKVRSLLEVPALSVAREKDRESNGICIHKVSGSQAHS